MKKHLVINIIFAILLSSCDGDYNNPFDPNTDFDFSPKNLSAEIISPYVIKLHWKSPTASIDGFKIDKKESTGNWQLDVAANLGNTTTFWIDYICKPGTEYNYRIRAIAGDNLSDYKSIIKKTPEGNPTGTFIDNRDGKIYKWVKIGDQTWMAENFAYMPYICSPETECGIWVQGYSGNNVDEAKKTTDYLKYGCLYDWYTANTLAPDGWHLPNDEEWSKLINFLGGSLIAGDKLRINGIGDATNESGFSVLPGCYKVLGSFNCVSSLFWSGLPQWAIDRAMTLQEWQNFTSSCDCYYIWNDEELTISDCSLKIGASVRYLKN